MAKFVYFICNNGSANLLKEELKKKHPYFNVAFSRQSFLTFKRSDGRESSLNFNPSCIFARAFGISLGKGKRGEIGQVLQSELKPAFKGEYVLHEWSLVEGESFTFRPELEEILPLKKAVFPEIDDHIIDIIKTGENDFFLGLRKLTHWQTPFVGGTPDFSLPEKAPSRAWLKTEEALRWTRANLQPGEVVLEIGSAPGGSVYNFLNRNLKVYGVDTGAMDPICLNSPLYTHLNLTMQKVEAKILKDPIHWLALDINQKPAYALRELRRLIPLVKKDLKGLFLTFKLTDADSIKRLDGNIRELQEFGLKVQGTQLFHNRNEAFFYAVPSN